MILNEVMKDTADAIREKTGKSELIKPVDFATEIKGITAGGSGESGGSTIEYLDLSAKGMAESAVATMSWMVKASVEGALVVAPTTVAYMEEIVGVGKFPIAAMVDLSAKVNLGQGLITLKDLIVAQGLSQEQIDSIPRLTKEQFYSLE